MPGPVASDWVQDRVDTSRRRLGGLCGRGLSENLRFTDEPGNLRLYVQISPTFASLIHRRAVGGDGGWLPRVRHGGLMVLSQEGEIADKLPYVSSTLKVKRLTDAPIRRSRT